MQAGCGQAPSAARPAPPQLDGLKIDASTPESAATSLLTHLQAELRAIANMRGEELRNYHRGLVDRVRPLIADAQLDRMRALGRSLDVKEDKLIEAIVVRWAAAIAYYADGLERNPVRVSESADRVAVDFNARGAKDSARIQVSCVHEAGGWKVEMVTFHTRDRAASPSSN